MIYRHEFIASLSTLNAWRAESAVRNYQLRILRGERFSVISPFNGRAYPMTSSILIGSDQIAYSFDQGRFFLLTGPQFEGYSLAGLLDVGWCNVFSVISPAVQRS